MQPFIYCRLLEEEVSRWKELNMIFLKDKTQSW